MKMKVLRRTVAFILFPLTIFQKFKELNELKRLQPKGVFSVTGKHRVHVNIQGAGKQTVVFDSGLGSFSLEWEYIQQALADYATTFSYDRAGYGWSGKNLGAGTSIEIVEDLRNSLNQLGVKPPYILVGHSFGGLNMRLYAQLYPNEVSSLLLIDSTNEYRFLPEYMDDERQRQFKRTLKEYKLGYILSVLGVTRLIKRPVWNKRLPSRYISLGYRTDAYEAIYKEYLSMKSSCYTVNNKTIDSSIPICILSAGKMNESWRSDQLKLKNISENCRHIVIEDSFHNIHLEKPNEVIKTIKELMDCISK